MKTWITAVLVIAACNLAATAQTKKDSVKLRSDIEAIRKGKQARTSTAKPSILRVNDSLFNRVDTGALKSNSPVPTPPSPNNPNPYSPRPTVINPNAPVPPPPAPNAVPSGTPKGPDSPASKKKQK